jgi:hypothetical protein
MFNVTVTTVKELTDSLPRPVYPIMDARKKCEELNRLSRESIELEKRCENASNHTAWEDCYEIFKDKRFAITMMRMDLIERGIYCPLIKQKQIN